MNVREKIEAVIEAANSKAPVGGLTHSYYRYPARFSPQFAGTVINLFSKKEDTVIDPFSGGGTSLVEAIHQGRRAIGTDINELAIFVSKTKTTPLSKKDIDAILNWWTTVFKAPQITKKHDLPETDEYYKRNVPWRLRKTLAGIHFESQKLEKQKQIDFVRCALLRTGQWALDCRTSEPSVKQTLNCFDSFLNEMLKDISKFCDKILESGAMKTYDVPKFKRILNIDAEELSRERKIPQSWLPAKLVVTSPPYPGVHVIYNRWQIRGRKETALPYWLIGSADGFGSSYYTFCDRQKSDLTPYFDKVERTFKNLHAMLKNSAWVFQLVSFSDPETQLEKYLNAMYRAGFREYKSSLSVKSMNTRHWREVPNRKWYANINPESGSKKEILLIHRPK